MLTFEYYCDRTLPHEIISHACVPAVDEAKKEMLAKGLDVVKYRFPKENMDLKITWHQHFDPRSYPIHTSCSEHCLGQYREHYADMCITLRIGVILRAGGQV